MQSCAVNCMICIKSSNLMIYRNYFPANYANKTCINLSQEDKLHNSVPRVTQGIDACIIQSHESLKVIFLILCSKYILLTTAGPPHLATTEILERILAPAISH